MMIIITSKYLKGSVGIPRSKKFSKGSVGIIRSKIILWTYKMLNLENIVSNKKKSSLENDDWPFRMLIIGP